MDRCGTRYGFRFRGSISTSDAHNSKDRFDTLCHVHADLSGTPCTPMRGKTGKLCYYLELEVVLLVGLTELKAQIRWTDSRTVCILTCNPR